MRKSPAVIAAALSAAYLGVGGIALACVVAPAAQGIRHEAAAIVKHITGDDEDDRGSSDDRGHSNSSRPRTITGTATAYDTTVDGAAYRLTVTQSFKVRTAGRTTPEYVGGYDWDESHTYGRKISRGWLSAGRTTTTTGLCTSVNAAGKACLTVRTPFTGKVITAAGNVYTQTGTLITEVNHAGRQATRAELGPVIKLGRAR